MKRFALTLFLIYGTNASSQNQVLDIDGNSYKIVTIGTQLWIGENLKVSRYRNGDPITTNLPDSIWLKSDSGAFTIYNLDSSLHSAFGKLYNWYAVADARGLCPAGWHVPSSAEWKTLEISQGLEEKGDFFKRHPFLREILFGKPGKKQNVGGKLKAVGYKSDGTGYWNHKPNKETNESGFSGLPGGSFYSTYVKVNGKYTNTIRFSYLGDFGAWWSTTEVPKNPNEYLWLKSNAWYFLLDQYERPYDDTMKMYNGLSVRCLKD